MSAAARPPGPARPGVGRASRTEGRPSTAAAPELLAGIAADLALLARLHDRELDEPTLAALGEVAPRDWLALPPDGDEAAAAFELLADAQRELGLDAPADAPADAPRRSQAAWLDELAADYAGLYLTHGYRSAPNESVWTTEDGLERQEPMFAVRGWLRRYGLQAADWRKRADDHLVNELLFVERLLRIGSADALRDAGRFLDAHLLRWLRDFAGRAASQCQTRFYAGLALLTLACVENLRTLLERITGERRRKPVVIPVVEAPLETCGARPYLPGTAESW